MLIASGTAQRQRYIALASSTPPHFPDRKKAWVSCFHGSGAMIAHEAMCMTSCVGVLATFLPSYREPVGIIPDHRRRPTMTSYGGSRTVPSIPP